MGYGLEPGNDVMMSYQANTNVVGMVLPSNSPGVHTLWMPVIPLADRAGAQAGSAGTVDSLPDV